jgi:hypothetical protein
MSTHRLSAVALVLLSLAAVAGHETATAHTHAQTDTRALA